MKLWVKDHLVEFKLFLTIWVVYALYATPAGGVTPNRYVDLVHRKRRTRAPGDCLFTASSTKEVWPLIHIKKTQLIRLIMRDIITLVRCQGRPFWLYRPILSLKGSMPFYLHRSSNWQRVFNPLKQRN